VLVPVAVFVPAGHDEPEGWEHHTEVAPRWWDLHLPEIVPTSGPADSEPVATSKRRAKKAVHDAQESLFDLPPVETPRAAPTPSPETGPAWLDALLASDMWKTQKRAAGRATLPEDRVRAVLAAMTQRGCVASFAALAADTGVPRARLGGFLVHLARVLNVDGYGVFDVNAKHEEVRMERFLLAQQFGIEVP
jgi:hypothetical protein